MSERQRLPHRTLGKNGPQVPCLGFGLMELSIAYGAPPLADFDRLKVLDRAWELGATFWDSAAGYGDNEVFIGKWIALHPERRQDIFLATKFGLGGKIDNGKATLSLDSSPENCRKSCEESLCKLGVQYIDLFYVHRFDQVTPVEKTMEVLVQLKNEGKIRHIGLSECSSNTLRRAFAIHPISAVQIEYNPWSLDIESARGTHLLQACRDLGVAVVSYSPLGRGFLTGVYKKWEDLPPTDLRHQLPRFSRANFAKNVELVDVFHELAAAKGCSPAQVVLAWILAQGDDFFPIPGTKTLAYLEQNVRATSVTITPADDKHVREVLSSLGGASGDRTVAANNPFADTPPL